MVQRLLGVFQTCIDWHGEQMPIITLLITYSTWVPSTTHATCHTARINKNTRKHNVGCVAQKRSWRLQEDHEGHSRCNSYLPKLMNGQKSDCEYSAFYYSSRDEVTCTYVLPEHDKVSPHALYCTMYCFIYLFCSKAKGMFNSSISIRIVSSTYSETNNLVY